MTFTPNSNRTRREDPAAGSTYRPYRENGSRPYNRPNCSTANHNNRNIYSHSSHRQEPMVDISSYSSRRQAANTKRTAAARQRRVANARRRQEAQVRYHDGFDPDDRATSVSRQRAAAVSARGGNTGIPRRPKRHHIVRNIVCILLLLAILLFAWLTALFSGMDRTHNPTSQSTYARTPEHSPDWSIKSSPWVTNILLIGIDQDSENTHRSDSMILLSIDRKHQKLKMTSFLRDTYAEIPNHGRQKLNSAFAYGGPAMTMQTLENNYRIKIDQYMAVNFDSFSTIINEVGGIDVTLNQGLCTQFNENLGTHFTPGKYKLKGIQALYYTRIRNYGNDYGRAQRQREVIGQIIKKMEASGPFKLNSVLKKIMPLIWTNIPASQLSAICMFNAPAVFFKQQTQQIPADNTFQGETLDSAGWVEVADMEQNCSLLRQFIYEDNSTN